MSLQTLTLLACIELWALLLSSFEALGYFSDLGPSVLLYQRPFLGLFLDCTQQLGCEESETDPDLSSRALQHSLTGPEMYPPQEAGFPALGERTRCPEFRGVA